MDREKHPGSKREREKDALVKERERETEKKRKEEANEKPSLLENFLVIPQLKILQYRSTRCRLRR